MILHLLKSFAEDERLTTSDVKHKGYTFFLSRTRPNNFHFWATKKGE